MTASREQRKLRTLPVFACVLPDIGPHAHDERVFTIGMDLVDRSPPGGVLVVFELEIVEPCLLGGDLRREDRLVSGPCSLIDLLVEPLDLG